MKIFAILFSLLIFSSCLFAQTSEQILATANNQNFTAKDLAPEAHQAFENLPATIAELRKQLLEQQIIDALLEAEAAAQKTTAEKLVEAEINSKVQNPTAKEIQAVYDANRAAIGNKTLEEIRPQIVEFLRRDAKQKMFADFVSNLKTKYKAALGKDAGAPNLKPFEVLATVNSKQITAEGFEAKNRAALNDFEADVYDNTRDALEQIVYSNLLVAEAKAQNIEAGDLIAREITDKMREFSPGEREKLESDLRRRLFQKYDAKFFLKEIAPVAQNISTDDDPSLGSINAPVTIVMFSDFQCPACSATHPVLKKVIAEYGDKIRFVERDFPLTQIHENAFRAALAAGAANAQGKFFEYIELLYNNQNTLDTASLKEFATRIGLDRKRFDADLDGEKFADEVHKDMADGKQYGITGTPTIFVNGVKVRRLSAEAFREAIEKALKQSTANKN
ncbi:MAG: DsbA family protein [Acidobacteriota bacterium]|nr:DsbA family protein [Acidobacteriota bacterium]